MSNSTNLALPYLEAAQSQKHVTVNDSLRALDAVVMLSVLDRDLTTPPGSPADGARYLVKATATGAWAGHDGKIAAYQDGAWEFYSAAEGWRTWIADEDLLVIYDGSAWVSPNAQNIALMGVNTTADATNKLAVASAAVLFNNVGNGVQTKLNKNAAGDTASFLFQTNWSGRAEIGTCGNDNFSFKVSPDGSSWYTGMTFVSSASGVPKLPSFATGSLPSASTAGAGAMAYDTTLGKLVLSNGSAWVAQT